ncbi:hypothetical protein ABOZ73_00350 [Caulobacter sp. 73W]|uniref:Alpha/beta hydrolase n=1 Tax=Caulobacter sp. 73W TaxID=3161137 RepID=A0AB39KSQ5_9CAUL
MNLAALFATALLAVQTQTPASVPLAVAGGEVLQVGEVPNILVRARGARGSLVVLTGGNGRLGVGEGATILENATNVLIRNAHRFAARGFNVLLVEEGTVLSEAVDHARQLGGPVTVVATSAGTPRAAEGLLAGATPDRLILTSGFLSDASGPSRGVGDILGDPAHLPETLVIHHRADGCRFTRPEGVQPFVDWASGRVSVVWLEGGTEEGNPCRFAAHHGFAGQDDELADAIADFAGQ